jgi:hypothetical protein
MRVKLFCASLSCPKRIDAGGFRHRYGEVDPIVRTI